jgi:hypothetical protein
MWYANSSSIHLVCDRQEYFRDIASATPRGQALAPAPAAAVNLVALGSFFSSIFITLFIIIIIIIIIIILLFYYYYYYYSLTAGPAGSIIEK